MENVNNARPKCIDSFNEPDQKSMELSKEELLSLVIKCANFAAEKHQDQRRKDISRTPYINHPLGSLFVVKTIYIGLCRMF